MSPLRLGILAFVIATNTVAVCLAADVDIELKPITRTIRPGDILFVEVAVTNLKDKPIKLSDLVRSPFVSMWFEVRVPGASEFRSVSTVGQREIGLSSLDAPLPLRGRMVSSEALVRRHPDRLLFSAVGKYLIRARLGPGEIAVAQSEAIEIVVESTNDDNLDHFESARPLIDFGIGLDGVSYFFDGKKYANAANQLSDSNLKQTLIWMSHIARIRDATDDEQRKAAREDLERIRKAAHPFVQNWISLTLAAELIHQKQLELASAELRKIKDGNAEKLILDRRIKSKIRNNAEIRGTPKS